jgi:hypothetical protein
MVVVVVVGMLVCWRAIAESQPKVVVVVLGDLNG